MISGGPVPAHRNKGCVLAAGLCLCLLLIPLPGQAETRLLQSQDQWAYALGFLEQRQYARAAAEFERFLFLFPRNPQVPRARHLVGLSLLYDGQTERARSVFQDILESETDTAWLDRARFLLAETYYREQRFSEAEVLFTAVVEESRTPLIKQAGLYRLGWSRLNRFQWEEAARAFEAVGPASPLRASAHTLALRAPAGQDLVLRSPVTAGSLAALLPGLGHVYLGRPKDGAVAFVLNGVFTWAALEAFSRDLEVLGAILSFAEIGWYTGNIYSAVNAAHKRNRKVRRDFIDSLEDRLDLRRLAKRRRGVALSLHVPF